VATASSDGFIWLWDAESGEQVRQINAHPGGVTALSWAADGTRLASAGQDGLGRVWDAATGRLLFTLIGHDTLLHDIAWSPDGSLLATAGDDSLVRVWDGRTGIEQFALPAAVPITNDLSWSPDSRRLAVSGGTKPRVWDVTTPIVRLVGYEAGRSPSVATNFPYWAPDGSWVGAGGFSDETYRLWDPDTGRLLRTFSAALADISIPNPAGNEIFRTGPPRIVNLETGERRLLRLPSVLAGRVILIGQWSPDGRLLALQDEEHPEYAVYDADTLELLTTGERRECGYYFPGVFSPDGGYLAHSCSYSEITSVRIVESLTGRVVQELEGHTDWTLSPAWSPDGSKLATTSADLTVRVWDVKRGQTLTVFTGHATAQPKFVDWSPNGTRVISGDHTGNLFVWDAETGGEVNRYYKPGMSAGQKWSPDGTRVLLTGLGAPEIRPVWQSTEELIAYAYECCVWRALTAEEREQFGLPPAEEAQARGER
jgi:WD40 repeat protein